MGRRWGRFGPLACPVIPKGCQTPADRSRRRAALTRRPTPGSASARQGRRGNRTSSRGVSAAQEAGRGNIRLARAIG